MPKIVDHQKRKDLIVDKATNIIAEHGFDELTIRGLASSLKISTGMITHYFAGKDEILFAALKAVHQRFYQRAETAVGESQGLEAIRQRMRATLPLTDTIRKDWSIMFQFWGRATHDSAFSAYMNKERNKLRQLDLDDLQRALELGEISNAVNLDHAFEQLDAMTTGMGIASVFNPRRLNKAKTHAIIDDTLLQLGKM